MILENRYISGICPPNRCSDSYRPISKDLLSHSLNINLRDGSLGRGPIQRKEDPKDGEHETRF